VSLVLDASATLAWIYRDERSAAISRVFESIYVTGAWVPAIWKLEVANGLREGMRRQRIATQERNHFLADLENLGISTDPNTDHYAWTITIALADRFRLTLYDACYLELAERREIPLATLDTDLRAAARALKIETLGA
jgi:predicted nucleic acid-binding protein